MFISLNVEVYFRYTCSHLLDSTCFYNFSSLFNSGNFRYPARVGIYFAALHIFLYIDPPCILSFGIDMLSISTTIEQLRTWCEI